MVVGGFRHDIQATEPQRLRRLRFSRRLLIVRERAALGANYQRVFWASVVSNLGDGVSTVAYPWLASAVTRNPLWISTILAATRLPWLVFSLPAGVITDRVDRRKLIASMDVIRFAITLSVAAIVAAAQDVIPDPSLVEQGLADPPTNAWVYLIVLHVAALGFGFAEVLRDNAAQTLMPSIVDGSQLETANGRLWGAETVMNSFAGPPLGGFLIAVGLAVPFFFDAGTFAISAALVFTLAGSFRPREGGNEPIQWRTEITAGVKWLWNHRLLRTMGLILGVMNAMFMVAFATYVLFVQEILGLEADAFGLLLTGAAAGGVAGSLLASRLSKVFGSGTSLFITLGGSAVTLAITGLTSSWGVVWAMAALGSFLGVLWNVITVSLRQQIIPDELLGRVNSVYRLFAWGMMPIGSVLGGVIVAVTDQIANRALALRMPFFFAAAMFLLCLAWALPSLSTRQIEAARSAAQPASSPSSTSASDSSDPEPGPTGGGKSD